MGLLTYPNFRIDTGQKNSGAAVFFAEIPEPLQVIFSYLGRREKIPQHGEQELVDRAEAPGDGIEYPDPFPPVFQPAGVFQEGELPRHCRLGQLQDRYEVADAEFVLLNEEGEDAETGFVVEGLEDGGDVFHGRSISVIPDIVKFHSGRFGYLHYLFGTGRDICHAPLYKRRADDLPTEY